MQQAAGHAFGTFEKRWLFLDTISHHVTITNVRKTRTKKRTRERINIIDQKKVAFIGAGSMAEGMIAGIVRSGQMPLGQIYATNRQNQLRLNELTKRYGIQTAAMDSFSF
ncbi:hypothetical protein BsIDN1_36260 [Bacillus safensis]|uniref:Pyrroline-5-carboxylate reductase catalytic N-terminal domain-containing protein n=1 Tax=Bacillus safensis TaxID=561879 RepID=A0A5S9MAS5_BACIA|nr:hypothetical protein BsIDN1_36260 [Bacillus safensis]